MDKSFFKVLLINPVTKNREKVLRVERCQQKVLSPVGLWPPSTLLEIALYLKYDGFKNIEIIDAEIEGMSFEGLKSIITEKSADMIVMQATTPTIEDDILLSNMVKKEIDNIKVVFIGLYATVFPAELLKNKSIDYVVLGEPENAVAQLANYCANSSADIRGIKGLGYKDNGDIYINEKNTLRQVYDYPIMPDRSLIKNELYIMPLVRKPFTVIKVSRGCDFACSFCTSRIYYGKGWKARSPENIIEEIKDVLNNYGIDTFLFLSDTFNNNGFADKLSLKIIENNLNIKWACNSRVDLINQRTAGLMKKAGCMLVSLGIESYDENILRKNRKYIPRRSIERGVAALKKNRILTYGYFILGLQGETKRSMLRTIIAAFCSKLDFAMFYSLTPFPGTEYFKLYNNLNWKHYFHGDSDIVEYKNLGKTVIKICRYLSFFMFYIRPYRQFLLLKYFFRGRLC